MLRRQRRRNAVFWPGSKEPSRGQKLANIYAFPTSFNLGLGTYYDENLTTYHFILDFKLISKSCSSVNQYHVSINNLQPYRDLNHRSVNFLLIITLNDVFECSKLHKYPTNTSHIYQNLRKSQHQTDEVPFIPASHCLVALPQTLPITYIVLAPTASLQGPSCRGGRLTKPFSLPLLPILCSFAE